MRYKDRPTIKFTKKWEGLPLRVEARESRGTGRREADEILQKSHAELKQHVNERTEELTRANEQLLQKIEGHRQAVESLRRALEEIGRLKGNYRRRTSTLRKR